MPHIQPAYPDRYDEAYAVMLAEVPGQARTLHHPQRYANTRRDLFKNIQFCLATNRLGFLDRLFSCVDDIPFLYLAQEICLRNGVFISAPILSEISAYQNGAERVGFIGIDTRATPFMVCADHYEGQRINTAIEGWMSGRYKRTYIIETLRVLAHAAECNSMALSISGKTLGKDVDFIYDRHLSIPAALLGRLENLMRRAGEKTRGDPRSKTAATIFNLTP